jgi:hypothetical protein
MSMYVDLLAKVPVSVMARGDNQYRKVIRVCSEPSLDQIKVINTWQEFIGDGWRTVTERASYKDRDRLMAELGSGRYQAL